MEVEVELIADFCEHVTRLRDPYENRHGRAVSKLAVALGKEDNMNKEELSNLALGARLHDAAKLLIPEAILNKPGRLTLQEWDMIKAHPTMGVRMFSIVKLHPMILDIILHHHENVDGTGYPDGIGGNELSRPSKIVRIVDTFESMTRKRSYKPQYTVDDTLKRMHRYVGEYFDPVIFDNLEKVLDRDGFDQEVEPHEIDR